MPDLVDNWEPPFPHSAEELERLSTFHSVPLAHRQGYADALELVRAEVVARRDDWRRAWRDADPAEAGGRIDPRACAANALAGLIEWIDGQIPEASR